MESSLLATTSLPSSRQTIVYTKHLHNTDFAYDLPFPLARDMYRRLHIAENGFLRLQLAEINDTIALTLYKSGLYTHDVCLRRLSSPSASIPKHIDDIGFDQPGASKWFGGGYTARRLFSYWELQEYPVVSSKNSHVQNEDKYEYVDMVPLIKCLELVANDPDKLAANIPYSLIAPCMALKTLQVVLKRHNVTYYAKEVKSNLEKRLSAHQCPINECQVELTLFHRTQRTRSKLSHSQAGSSPFPPLPPTKRLIETVVRGFCEDTQPSSVEEDGCACCGQLTPLASLVPLNLCNLDLRCLEAPSVMKTEVPTSGCSVFPATGPVLDRRCNHICVSCKYSVQRGKRPKYALANGFWLGEVPDVLKQLTFAEKMLITRIRHNRCLVRVASGRAKLIANAIMFATPIVKVYHRLPPSIEELDEILAVIFIGSNAPTDEEFRRTPMLVRRNAVARALEWLKLNHTNYADLEISKENLDRYPLNGIPVVVDYRKADPDQDVTDLLRSQMSKHETNVNIASDEGMCPFVVNGVTGTEYADMSIKALKAKALEHLVSGGKVLGVGRNEEPASMYKNPSLYPQMFPWLFPYGLGGVGAEVLKKKITELDHKRWLLMYWDKRFQTDFYFPMIAFNHEQMKSNATRSHLIAKRSRFNEISKRIKSLDVEVLKNISSRLADGEIFKPETDGEKACFKLIDDLDYVGGSTMGSISSKKLLRNELWSLISWKGAPTWFITLSPADGRHPLCLYYAGSRVAFDDKILPSSIRDQLVLSNPVAAARFFDFIVRMFIKHVLGVGSHTSTGLYGKTSAYYGTVEQQGRLTLHLHMLIWICGSLSPGEIRNRLLSKDSEFQKALIDYLEGCHQGELFQGPLEVIKEHLPAMPSGDSDGIHFVRKGKSSKALEGYEDPTLTRPVPPPRTLQPLHEPICNEGQCLPCDQRIKWWNEYNRTVDDLLIRCNVHSCRYPYEKKDTNTGDIQVQRKACLDKEGICKARFPRETHAQSTVDSDGHVTLRHLESTMNTFTPCVTYLLRCNTDVGNLLSGTAIKAIVSYVTDYITKSMLKSHQIFSAAYDIYQKNPHLSEHSFSAKARRDTARRLILKLSNNITSKLEIGSPMASMYLLGNPDRYSNYTFANFWWRSYVRHVISKSDDYQGKHFTPVVELNFAHEEGDAEDETVMLKKKNGDYVPWTNVDDYIYRPCSLSQVSLVDWIRCTEKRKMTSAKRETVSRDQSGTLDFDTDRPEWLLFLPDHPQYNSHHVKFDLHSNTHRIPNFMGGALPRRDQGDVDYYYITMLTLFKPWRSPSDLKSIEQSWKEAFDSHHFKVEFKRIMANFNVRYECLDERDDYHNILKQKRKEAIQNHVFNPFRGFEDNDQDDKEVDELMKELMSKFAEDECSELVSTTGYKSRRNDRDKLKAHAILEKLNWLDKCDRSNIKEVHRDRRDCESVFLSTSLSASHWKNVVQSAKKALLTSKQQSRIESLTSSKLRQITDNDVTPSAPFSQWRRSRDGVVRLLDRSYLLHDYHTRCKTDADIVHSTIEHFSLNKEQTRAFKIIANHACSPSPDQLKMYLGGMGGTGKSQVIKALIHMFSSRGESHRFIVVAPTGTAAALLNGSTYHSVLGIISRSNSETDDVPIRSESTLVLEARDRLNGVDYIFLDEVSMISCTDMYNISTRLSKVTGVNDEPFGGLNIIFAGDFAQLPPTGGHCLYSHCPIDDDPKKVWQETAIIGKFLWHQVTTVVMLTQNMRQRTRSEEDNKLRTALENMRYASCTPDDVRFIKSRVINNSNVHLLQDEHLRNVSIITSLNNFKDQYNKDGARRFALDNDQKLVEFRSVDFLTRVPGTSTTKSRGRRKTGKNRMTEELQKVLWKLDPNASDHVAGVLPLCVGMPVMIRHNDATELCITKGQEAIVVGWDSIPGPYNSIVLDTLFVRLVNPPKTVQIRGLPENIVPIPRTKNPVNCLLPDDTRLRIEREQVNVLLNFSMTDYASQGKTRKENIIDLSNSRTFHHMYTSLSRSSNANGTLIITDFDESKITGGIKDGRLRQEFRELNILDRITELRHRKKLNNDVTGDMRYPLIHSFLQSHKHSRKDLDFKWHESLKPSPEEPTLPDLNDYSVFYKINRTIRSKLELTSSAFKSDKMENDSDLMECVPPHSMTGSKRKRQLSPVGKPLQDAKRTRSAYHSPVTNAKPIGLIWDSVNYSCAYDAIFTILINTVLEDIPRGMMLLSNQSSYLQTLAMLTSRFTSGEMALEQVRDRIRAELNFTNPFAFPYGPSFIFIHDLVTELFPNDKVYGETILRCEICGNCRRDNHIHLREVTSVLANRFQREVCSSVYGLRHALYLDAQPTRNITCDITSCPGRMMRSMSVTEIPSFLLLSIDDTHVCPEARLTLSTHGDSNTLAIFNLKGLIYGNNNHFVARYVDASDRVWFHDGMSFQRQCQLHGILTLDQPAHWLKRCDDKQLIYTWYSKTPNPPI